MSISELDTLKWENFSKDLTILQLQSQIIQGNAQSILRLRKELETYMRLSVNADPDSIYNPQTKSFISNEKNKRIKAVK